MDTRKILKYSLIALIVIILGALSGWYLYLKRQGTSTAERDAARGYDTSGFSTRLGGQGGGAGGESSGFLKKIYNTVFGGGTGTSETTGSDSFGTAGPAVDTAGTTGTTTRNKPPRLWHVRDTPVAGIALVGSGASTRLRYVERATGYVFEADPESGEIVRLTNTLTPKIYEALFSSTGRVTLRSLDEGGGITTFVGTIPRASATSTATSSRPLALKALPANISRIAFSPRGDEIFYLTLSATSTTGIRAAWDGSGARKVFTSSARGWRIQWVGTGAGRIILTQAAADGVPGYAYELKADGTLAPLQRNVPGLVYLPSAGTGALWSASDGGISVYAQTTASTSIISLPIETIADKCAWVPGKTTLICGVPHSAPAGYLDAWYQGAVHTADDMWRVTPGAGEAERFFALENTDIDVDLPVVDPSETYFAFLNAADGTPWVLRIEQ